MDRELMMGKTCNRVPHRFIRDIEPALGQQVLDIAVAQGEAKIQPNRVLDDLGREAMTAVTERSHVDILTYSPPHNVSVTMPAAAITGA